MPAGRTATVAVTFRPVKVSLGLTTSAKSRAKFSMLRVGAIRRPDEIGKLFQNGGLKATLSIEWIDGVAFLGAIGIWRA